MSSAIPPPPPGDRFGYSCQVWLSIAVQESLGGSSRYYTWFARQLNPIQNGESSNPLTLYATIDTAAKKSDLNHSKIKDLKAALLAVVNRRLKPADPGLARRVRRTILRSPIEMFRPQIWRLDLGAIDPVRIRTDRSVAGWDEQYVTDLETTEFEVIVP